MSLLTCSPGVGLVSVCSQCVIELDTWVRRYSQELESIVVDHDVEFVDCLSPGEVECGR